MKQRLSITIIALLLIIFAVSACGTAPPAQPTATPSGSPGLETAPPAQIQPTAESLPDSYPPPPPAPVQPTREPNYPPPPTFPPTVDPYPGGLVWIIRPVGVQCEDGTAEGYGDLRESVATLTAAGLQVENSEMIDLMVPAACGSPTSAHYRIQINVDGLNTANSMGWQRELN